MSKFGRVYNYHIKLRPFVAVVAQNFKGIACQIFVLWPFKAIEYQVALGLLQRWNGTVYVNNALGTVGGRIHGKSPGVGKKVEDGLVVDVGGVTNGRSVLPLIQIKPRLMPRQKLHPKTQPVLAYFHRFRRHAAP